jgi:hypothetical protein
MTIFAITMGAFLGSLHLIDKDKLPKANGALMCI